MESTKSSSQYQLPSPMIIAMKGPSNNKKLEIASSLAQFLHYPLIDEEDVTLDLKNSLTGFPKELPFKIVTQITKTQLQVKLQVIINTSLSQDTHIDHWLELARSKGAHLLIVECTNEGSQGSEHGVGYAPVLRIDISKPFTVEEFVPTIMNAVEFHEKANHEGKSQPEVSKEITQVHETIPQRIFMEAHAHEFSFTTEPKMDSTKLRCNYCEDFISGPTYQCIECDGFILHKSCAETQKIQNPIDVTVQLFKVDVKKLIITMGPWGGTGNKWDDGIYSTVRCLLIDYGEAIVSLRIEYDNEGHSKWGAKQGAKSTFNIEGTYD
ncbi:conserved hypothetical protein [Ricinus communis]|uniref:Jacalin-type lectin domain-containing protein n=1 Tax=Ricinus communis TaxID=3988 RepID=B9SM16_RICCO|nr:conserved hypothetical protein [Ricinus communis]